MGPVHVVSSRDDDRHAERSLVRLSEKLGTRLGGGIRIGGFKYLVEIGVMVMGMDKDGGRDDGING